MSRKGGNPNWVKGGLSPNPHGLSKAARATADKVRNLLSTEEFSETWRVAYLNQIKEENPLILKDYADRVLGKPKEYIQVSEDPDAPLSPHYQLSLEELKAVARNQLCEEAKTINQLPEQSNEHSVKESEP